MIALDNIDIITLFLVFLKNKLAFVAFPLFSHH